METMLRTIAYESAPLVWDQDRGCFVTEIRHSPGHIRWCEVKGYSSQGELTFNAEVDRIRVPGVYGDPRELFVYPQGFVVPFDLEYVGRVGIHSTHHDKGPNRAHVFRDFFA